MELENIVIGMNAEQEFLVEEQYTAGYVGSGSMNVLATPSLVAFVERVAYNLLQESLPNGASNVGSYVEMHHLTPSPAGSIVRVICQVEEINGHKIQLKFEAWDTWEKIAEGLHSRVVIDASRFIYKLENKAIK